MTRRIVVWGTGFVEKMVIAEIVGHPLFDLVGVGVSNPEKAGRDVGEICGLGARLDITATDDVDALIALAPDAVVHYGPTAAHADANIDVCSTSMTPWVWPAMHLDPPNWIRPVTDACEAGRSSCFTTGIDPGFANDLFPMTLMGLCAEVRRVSASELLDYTNYEGECEFEMGIGMPPEHRALLQTPEILIFAWDATVPVIAHAAGIELDEMTTTWDTWVTSDERKTAKGIIAPATSRRSGSPSTGYSAVRRRFSRSTSTASARMLRRTGPPASRTTCTASTSTALRASSRRPRSASPTAPAVTRQRPGASRRACGRSTPFSPSTTCRPGG